MGELSGLLGAKAQLDAIAGNTTISVSPVLVIALGIAAILFLLWYVKKV